MEEGGFKRVTYRLTLAGAQCQLTNRASVNQAVSQQEVGMTVDKVNPEWILVVQWGKEKKN